MTSPITGSAQFQPSATPPAPSRTASDVSPSVRACRPSATSAAEPILRPVRIRYRAAETILCATLAATTPAGLVLFAVFGW